MKRLQSEKSLDLEADFVRRFRQRSCQSQTRLDVLRVLAALILRSWLRLFHRFEIVGHEQLRTNRSLVIVANHCSHLDTLCLLAALPLRKLHKTFPAAAADYFFQSVPRTWMAAMINAMPFGRQANVRRSLSICSELLSDAGNILIIFPEGTRSTTGETQQFKLGVAAVVAGQDVAVMPCYLQGTYEAWPKGRRLPRPKKIRLIVGAACNYASSGTDKSELYSIASGLHSAVRMLSATK